MNSSTRLGLALSLQLLAGGAFLACGGDDPEEPGTEPVTPGDKPATEPTGATGGGLTVLPLKAYSAYDGEHEFLVPVKVDGMKGAEWTVSDKSKVDIDKAADGSGATLKVKAAGKVTVTATIGKMTGSTELTITEATPAQWTAGKERYSNGIPAIRMGAMGMSAADYINFEGACTSCHGATASDLKVEHTPLQTAGYSDADMVTLITMGMKPAGAVQRTQFPAAFWGMGHRWQLTEEQKTGIIVYLRSLPPQSQGEFDYPIRPVDGGYVTRDGAVLTGRRDASTDASSGLTTTADAGVESDAGK